MVKRRAGFVQVFGNHQLGEVRRQFHGARFCGQHGDAHAVQAGAAHLGAERLGPLRVRLDGDDVQVALAQQLRDQPAGADAPGDAVAAAGAGGRQNVVGLGGPLVVIGGDPLTPSPLPGGRGVRGEGADGGG